VPAAAVKRIVQVFDHVTRCKRLHRRLVKLFIKHWNNFSGKLIRLTNLNLRGVLDTLHVKVKFVEM
jgi:hypothetical protein